MPTEERTEESFIYLEDEERDRFISYLSYKHASIKDKALAAEAIELLKNGHLLAKAKPETIIDKAMNDDTKAFEKFKAEINKSPALEEYIETNSVSFIRESALKHIRRADFINARQWYNLLGNRGTFRDRFRIAMLEGLVDAQKSSDITTQSVKIPQIKPETAFSKWLSEIVRQMKTLENKLSALKYEAYVEKCEEPDEKIQAVRNEGTGISSFFGVAAAAAAVYFLRERLVDAWRWFGDDLLGKILRLPACLILLLAIVIGGFLIGFLFVALLQDPGKSKKLFPLALDKYRAVQDWSAGTETYSKLQALRAELTQKSVPPELNNSESLHYLYYLSRIYDTSDLSSTIALSRDLALHPESYPHQKTEFTFPDKPLDWFVQYLYRDGELKAAVEKYNKYYSKRGSSYDHSTYPYEAFQALADRIYSSNLFTKPYQYLAFYIHQCGESNIHHYSKAEYLDILWDLSLPCDHIHPDVCDEYMKKDYKITRYQHDVECLIGFKPAHAKVQEFLTREERSMDAMSTDEQRDFARCMFIFYRNHPALDPDSAKAFHYCRMAAKLDSPAMLMQLVHAYRDDALEYYPPYVLPSDKTVKSIAKKWFFSQDKELSAYGRNILSYYEELAENASRARAAEDRQREIREQIADYTGPRYDVRGNMISGSSPSGASSGSSSRSGGVHNVLGMPSTITGPYGHSYVRISISSDSAEYQNTDTSEIVTIYDGDIGPTGHSATGGFYW